MGSVEGQGFDMCSPKKQENEDKANFGYFRPIEQQCDGVEGEGHAPDVLICSVLLLQTCRPCIVEHTVAR